MAAPSTGDMPANYVGETGSTRGIAAPQFIFSNANGASLFSGSGAPTTPGGANPVAGDFYFRTDTPGTASQRIYVCTVGGGTPTWVALV